MLPVAAPIDSAAVAGALAGAAAGWLNTTFPGLDSVTLGRLSVLLGSLPVIVLIWLWETVGKGLGKFLPGLEVSLGPFWAKYKVILNPILGLIFGTVGGNPLLGLLASGVWSVGSGAVKAAAGPSTAAGRARAGMGLILLGCLLFLPHGAQAAPLKMPATPAAVQPAAAPIQLPFTVQAGLGEKVHFTKEEVQGNTFRPYVWTHLTWPVRDHWILRARLENELLREGLTNLRPPMEGRLEFGFSFP
jgi:hypothetical protein